MLSYVFLSGNWYGKWTNSNRFISCLVDQKLIRIIRISALTFTSSTVTFDLIFFITLCYFLNCEEVLPEFCIDIDVFFFWVFYWSFVCSFLKDFNEVFWLINYYYYYCYYYFRLTPSSTVIARILEEEVVLSGYLVPAQVSLSTWPLHIQECAWLRLFVRDKCFCLPSKQACVSGLHMRSSHHQPTICRIRNTHGKKISIFHYHNFFSRLSYLWIYTPRHVQKSTLKTLWSSNRSAG